MDSTEDTKRAARVGPEDVGGRLDKFLATALPELSRARVKALLEAGRVSQGGATISEASYRVKPGERFMVSVPPPAEPRPRGEAIPLTIAFEDADLIVVDKPAGLVVHPAPGNPDHTLVNALIAHCGVTLSGIGGVRRPGIVHRLDKDTSGLLVAAKNDAAHAGLAEQFAAHTIERVYEALVWGVPTPRRGEIAGNIGRNPRNRKKMAVLGRGGKPARTGYRVVRRFGEALSLVECRLTTGRTHQIRVHLSARGHPIVGDPLYGRARSGLMKALPEPARRAIETLHRQALHAGRLGFRHPSTGKMLRFESRIPSDIRTLIDILEEI